MVFLCMADLHGSMPPISGFAGRPDAILLLGDLEWAVEKIAEIFPDVPMFGVPGNHDSRIDPFYGIPVENLHGRVVEFRGVKIGGLGGCLRYKPFGGYLFWDEEYREILEKMLPVDILISHCPPAGLPWCDPPFRRTAYHEAHEGSAAMAEYILRTDPAIVLCGHLHISAAARMGKTLVRVIHGVEQFTCHQLDQPHVV
ncbi:hypothetical protein AN618_18660 [Fervidicola ferrireducens]|uniref:Calcineurin-like phosphoesterase domain-containing protein n=1 Tax=Fervidicola ferrireducens TaxID=520764 RepID=A0A140L4M3_9FIRM|nr:hypothetical protein AN618_18660 [Fervidicola ferrireducens]